MDNPFNGHEALDTSLDIYESYFELVEVQDKIYMYM